MVLLVQFCATLGNPCIHHADLSAVYGCSNCWLHSCALDSLSFCFLCGLSLFLHRCSFSCPGELQSNAVTEKIVQVLGGKARVHIRVRIGVRALLRNELVERYAQFSSHFTCLRKLMNPCHQMVLSSKHSHAVLSSFRHFHMVMGEHFLVAEKRYGVEPSIKRDGHAQVENQEEMT